MSTALLVMWMWLHGQAQTRAVQYGNWNVAVAGEAPSLAELVDVPAVQEIDDRHVKSLCYHGRTFKEWDQAVEATDNFKKWAPIIDAWPSKRCNGRDWEEQMPTTWTCSDKSRVLLTSEDGTKHCIKFGGR